MSNNKNSQVMELTNLDLTPDMIDAHISQNDASTYTLGGGYIPGRLTPKMGTRAAALMPKGLVHFYDVRAVRRGEMSHRGGTSFSTSAARIIPSFDDPSELSAELGLVTLTGLFHHPALRERGSLINIGMGPGSSCFQATSPFVEGTKFAESDLAAVKGMISDFKDSHMASHPAPSRLTGTVPSTYSAGELTGSMRIKLDYALDPWLGEVDGGALLSYLPHLVAIEHNKAASVRAEMGLTLAQISFITPKFPASKTKLPGDIFVAHSPMGSRVIIPDNHDSSKKLRDHHMLNSLTLAATGHGTDSHPETLGWGVDDDPYFSVTPVKYGAYSQPRGVVAQFPDQGDVREGYDSSSTFVRLQVVLGPNSQIESNTIKYIDLAIELQVVIDNKITHREVLHRIDSAPSDYNAELLAGLRASGPSLKGSVSIDLPLDSRGVIVRNVTAGIDDQIITPPYGRNCFIVGDVSFQGSLKLYDGVLGVIAQDKTPDGEAVFSEAWDASITPDDLVGDDETLSSAERLALERVIAQRKDSANLTVVEQAIFFPPSSVG